MKNAPVTLLVMSLLMAAAAQESTQIPKGINAAGKAAAEIEKSIPRLETAHVIKPEDLQREADQLATLAQSIPADIDSVHKGKLPKDVIQKLKRIEKLSKRIRTELNP